MNICENSWIHRQNMRASNYPSTQTSRPTMGVAHPYNNQIITSKTVTNLTLKFAIVFKSLKSPVRTISNTCWTRIVWVGIASNIIFNLVLSIRYGWKGKLYVKMYVIPILNTSNFDDIAVSICGLWHYAWTWPNRLQRDGYLVLTRQFCWSTLEFSKIHNKYFAQIRNC